VITCNNCTLNTFKVFPALYLKAKIKQYTYVLHETCTKTIDNRPLLQYNKTMTKDMKEAYIIDAELEKAQRELDHLLKFHDEQSIKKQKVLVQQISNLLKAKSKLTEDCDFVDNDNSEYNPK